MGITIHYRFGIYDEQTVERVLTEIKGIAENSKMEIRGFALKEAEKILIVNPAEGCETINLGFKRWGDIKAKHENSKEWNYAYDVLKHYFSDLSADMWVCTDFTKTQFAGDITHVRVAEILRYLASFCSLVLIYDEAGYYETRDKEKMLNAFGECSRLIGSIIGKLKEAGWKEENIVRGGY